MAQRPFVHALVILKVTRFYLTLCLLSGCIGLIKWRFVETRMGRRDQLTDSARTKLWMEYCRCNLSASSLYAIEHKLKGRTSENEAASFFFDRGKWSYYSKGGHVPRKPMVSALEQSCPGSATLLAHPLWQICRLQDGQASVVADSLFKGLRSTLVQRLFHVAKDDAAIGARKLVTKRTLTYLEGRGDLDGLAALSLLILESSELERHSAALDAGQALFRAMLRLPFLGSPALVKVAPDIFQLLCARIFPRARSTKQHICTDGIQYGHLVQLLRFAIDPHLARESANTSYPVLERLFSQPLFTSIGPLYFAAPIQDTYPSSPARFEDRGVITFAEHWQRAFCDLEVLNRDGFRP